MYLKKEDYYFNGSFNGPVPDSSRIIDLRMLPVRAWEYIKEECLLYHPLEDYYHSPLLVFSGDLFHFIIYRDKDYNEFFSNLWQRMVSSIMTRNSKRKSKFSRIKDIFSKKGSCLKAKPVAGLLIEYP